ncbi:Hypothetical protein SMAX5B_021696 [Scophthalmus maximus]|uniref:Uncharacterized protein n=1 Tax=Scophthalmus maximus TaxID=52904 RepID=A0A2U9C9A6_SCOMX|nr:Hypothetical protein SMAX5B_021696 [Scophthalmus maximus]
MLIHDFGFFPPYASCDALHSGHVAAPQNIMLRLIVFRQRQRQAVVTLRVLNKTGSIKYARKDTLINLTPRLVNQILAGLHEYYIKQYYETQAAKYDKYTGRLNRKGE